MNIIFPIIFNIVAVVVFYLLEKRTAFAKIRTIYKQLIIGGIFGGIAIAGSELGWETTGAIMNVRDSAPLSAGLIFGWQSGIIAGIIGGVYRVVSVYWGAGTYTAAACAISTFFAGVIAALLRKYMFNDKKPTWAYAFGIAVVMEVFHMLMILMLNINDADTAFAFVRQFTIIMCVLNALTVSFSVFIITLISKERIKREKGKEQIAQTFQRWLVISIVSAFIVTSIFTYNLQTSIRERQIQDTFKTSIIDVITDIKDKSNDGLLEIAKQVKNGYLTNTSYSASELIALDEFNGKITDVNLISSTGKVVDSTDPNNVEYDFNSDAQSKEFLTNLIGKDADTWFVQGYQKNGFDVFRKYAGITLPNDNSVPEKVRGGIIQVSYNDEQFHENLDKFVIDFTKNRHVGAKGFIAVCDEELRLVTETKRDNMPVDVIGIKPNEEMLAKTSASKIYETDIVNSETDYKEKYLYVFTFAEGYCIIAAMPEAEVMLLRDTSAYLSIFMEVIIFGALFVMLYFLIKKLVIDNIHKINKTLSKISSGNLNEMVNVRSNIEFASLSDDINTTVDTLKRYIKEAAARIDKELEYAKQIQLSALPNNFPSESTYEIYAQMIAAKEIGGDFYDFYKLNEKTIAFLVADVSGKGIPAAMFMMTAKTIIRALAERGLSANEIFTQANEKLCENNESGMFVTAWMGILDVATGKLTYANAGHNPPLIYKAKDGAYEYLKSRAGLVLAGMDGIKYRINELQLEKGDKILLYTDGVTEATDAKNNLYGEQRLKEFMNKSVRLSPKEVLIALKEDVDRFASGAPQFDDITMLVFDYIAGDKTESNVICSEKIFPAKTQALTDVIEFLESNLEKFNCPMKTVMSLSVAIEEVFVNVANYAYEGTDGQVKFKTSFDEQTREIVFEMIDNGVPFNPLLKPDPDVTLSAEERNIGGLGIFIAKKTMDKISYRYENGENILTMIKNI